MSTGLVEIRAVVQRPVAPGGPGREGIVSVEVRLPTVLRPHAGGQSTVTVEGATIGEVLADLVRNYPAMAGQVLTEDGTLHRFVNVYVDDDDVRYLDQLDTKVGPGVTVTILPAVAGG